MEAFKSQGKFQKKGASSPKQVNIRFPVTSLNEFIRVYRNVITMEGIFLLNQRLPERCFGQGIAFALMLKTEVILIAGRATIIPYRRPFCHGIILRFESLERDGRDILSRIMSANSASSEKASDDCDTISDFEDETARRETSAVHEDKAVRRKTSTLQEDERTPVAMVFPHEIPLVDESLNSHSDSSSDFGSNRAFTQPRLPLRFVDNRLIRTVDSARVDDYYTSFEMAQSELKEE